MRKHRKLFLLCSCLAALTGLVALLARDREPAHQGRSLSEWLTTYQEGVELPYRTMPVEWMGHTPTAKQAQAADAVRHIGTNAIPFLLRRLQYQDQSPKWKHRLYRIASRLPDSKPTRYLLAELYPTIPAYEIRGSAFLGLALLGDEASSAAPALLRLAEDPDPSRAYRALGALSCVGNRGFRELMAIAADPQSPNQVLAIKQFAAMRHMGTNASPAVPILVRCAADPDPEVAWEAIYSLCILSQEFDLCFPVFTNAIASTNKHIRIGTIHHLVYFHPATVLRPLTPSLLNCLNNPDDYVRTKAAEALSYIAPEVLTNAPSQ